MPIENVTLPLTGTGGTTAAVAVDTSPEGQIQVVKLAIATDGSSVLIPANLDGIFIQPRLESPQDDLLIATALAAGGNADLDATTITTGKTGRLMAVDVGSSVPVRCDIQTVSGARVTRTSIYTSDGRSELWRSPGLKFIELVGAVGVRFGVSVTNLSALRTADVRVTVYWDEVT